LRRALGVLKVPSGWTVSQSMIPKSGYRFSEKIMLHEDEPGILMTPFVRVGALAGSLLGIR